MPGKRLDQIGEKIRLRLVRYVGVDVVEQVLCHRDGRAAIAERKSIAFPLGEKSFL